METTYINEIICSRQINLPRNEQSISDAGHRERSGSGHMFFFCGDKGCGVDADLLGL